MGSRDGRWWTPSPPRPVQGGIRASSHRGGFTDTWWGKRWVEVLEGFDVGQRLARGRRYARLGQVLSIDVSKGVVEARVQGSMAKPYSVKIKVRVLSAEEWSRVTEQLGRKARFVAQLLAGEMPPEIEEAFGSAGVSLFPDPRGDLRTDCSCPDWSNPCKHVAAVYYLLAGEFDRDPFLIMRLRGMDRDELLACLSSSKPAAAEAPAPPAEAAAEPLPTSPAVFWDARPAHGAVQGATHVPVAHAALIQRLGALPFWRGTVSLDYFAEVAYEYGSARGMAVHLGEAADEGAAAAEGDDAPPPRRRTRKRASD